MSNTPSATEDRALALLGSGLQPSVVASAIGVSESRISQLLSQPDFAQKVAELRYASLLKNNDRDAKIDALEDKLLEKLENVLIYMVKPMEIVHAVTKINAMKRRGASSPDISSQQSQVVQLVMPAVIYNQFTQQNLEVNMNKQVIKAGDQSLITMQSGRMDDLLKARLHALKNSTPQISQSPQLEVQDVQSNSAPAAGTP